MSQPKRVREGDAQAEGNWELRGTGPIAIQAREEAGSQEGAAVAPLLRTVVLPPSYGRCSAKLC